MDVSRIKDLAKKQGKTITYICSLIGRPKYYLIDVQKSKGTVSENDLKIIAKELNTTVDYLTFKTDVEQEPQGVLGVFNPQYVPIVGSVKAGWNGIAETEFEGKHVAFGKADYSEYVFMRIKGDSMSPKMENGDLALVHLQNYAANGDYAVVIVNGDEGTVKIYRELENGALLLSPVNPAYAAVFVPKEANKPVIIYGVVKGITRDF